MWNINLWHRGFIFLTAATCKDIKWFPRTVHSPALPQDCLQCSIPSPGLPAGCGPTSLSARAGLGPPSTAAEGLQGGQLQHHQPFYAGRCCCLHLSISSPARPWLRAHRRPPWPVQSHREPAASGALPAVPRPGSMRILAVPGCVEISYCAAAHGAGRVGCVAVAA